jgi:hypothetical protein
VARVAGGVGLAAGLLALLAGLGGAVVSGGVYGTRVTVPAVYCVETFRVAPADTLSALSANLTSVDDLSNELGGIFGFVGKVGYQDVDPVLGQARHACLVRLVDPGHPEALVLQDDAGQKLAGQR